MRTHKLKTWPEFFEEVVSGRKTFEVRRDDRGFAVGDILVLKEYDPAINASSVLSNGGYTEREETFQISYKLRGGDLGIEKGYCVLGLSKTLEPTP